ncbi:MAG: hypothetical protein ACM3WU_10170 [Bacillota bacterium]
MSIPWVALAKLLGSALIVAAGGIAGFSLAGRLEGRLLELQRLESGLVCLLSEISYSLTPLPDALTRAGERAGGQIGVLLCRCGMLTGLSQRRTAEDAFAQAVLEFGAETLPAARAILTDLSRYLGTSGHKEQVRYIEMSIDKAKRLRQDFEEDCRKRAKLYRYLGVFGGAGVAVVLL